MDEELHQITARLTVHEFAIEVMLANIVVSLGEQEGDSFLAEFQRRMRFPYITDQERADDPDLLQLAQDATAIAERLVEKVRSRAASIRRQIGGD